MPVLKTGEGNTSGGSNPPLPAIFTIFLKSQNLKLKYCNILSKKEFLMNNKKAILLMNMGGPSNLNEVELFLSNICLMISIFYKQTRLLEILLTNIIVKRG